MRRFKLMVGFAALLFFSARADAQPYKAEPSEYVGAAGDCGAMYPAGHNIVTAKWLKGMGLPDDGVSAHPDGGNHEGLLLSKNGPTSDCSAAGAHIANWPTTGAVLTQLGFDYRNGTSCGGGAPRFNLYGPAPGYAFIGFLGCNNGLKSGAPQDPTQFTRVLFNAANGDPGQGTLVFGVTLVGWIDINFDEGTDTALAEFPGGPGLVVLDNININGSYTTRENPGSQVTFLFEDNATKGNWRIPATYGSDGYLTVNDAQSNPSYVNAVLPAGQSNFTWTIPDPTADVRALQRAAPNSGRRAGTWFRSTSFDINIDFNDGLPHQVALYMVDWDSVSRNQTIEIRDAVTNALLDTRTALGFNGGRYLVYTITGDVKITVTRVGGVNAVISGVFFD